MLKFLPRLSLLLLALCAAPIMCAQAEWFSAIQDKMGTRVEVRLWHDDEKEAEQLIALAMTEFDRIEAAMSTYLSNSEITRINETAAAQPVTVSPELFALIERALQLSVTTNGAFDITYDSVGQLYDFRAGTRPAPEQIAAQLDAINYRHVQLDREISTIRFARPEVRINLGGIAKGYAVESVIDVLRDAGVTNGLATAGGDTRLLGDRGNGPWTVGIRDPDDTDGLLTRLTLQDEAISTSGDYERFFIEDGVRYHHILNPSTGRSAGKLHSVTIIGPDATMTDGLSTSVFVLGADAGLALIESLEDYETLLVDIEQRVRFSSGLAH
ncbi:MAG: FAD:protein FMN transferase [Gammaproteobacteria bacterium]|jgi:thiamine biosynthesis lipoprotein|nr:FAD:protein FMN transferase [Gammaproteobacteria bacterium]